MFFFGLPKTFFSPSDTDIKVLSYFLGGDKLFVSPYWYVAGPYAMATESSGLGPDIRDKSFVPPPCSPGRGSVSTSYLLPIASKAAPASQTRWSGGVPFRLASSPVLRPAGERPDVAF